MELYEPLYSVRHRTNIMARSIGFLGMFLVVLAIVVGAKGTDDLFDAGVFLVIGLSLFFAHWFLAPRHYNVYDDQLIISYGSPRKKVIFFEEITDLEVIRHRFGAEIKVLRGAGRRPVHLQPWHPRLLHESLEENLRRFHGAETEEGPTL